MSISPPQFVIATIVVVITGPFLVGCAASHSEWKPAGYYVTDQSVYGCDSFEGAKGTVMKKTALLSLSLQRRLLEVLDDAASADKELLEELDSYRDHLLCWYETPEKDVELSLGAHCDSPFRITFHPRGGEWVVAHASRAIVICSTKRRRAYPRPDRLLPPNASLEHTREG